MADDKLNILLATSEGVQLVGNLDSELQVVSDQNEKMDVYKPDQLSNEKIYTEIKNSVTNKPQNELSRAKIESFQNDLKNLVLSEAENTRKMISEFLKDKISDKKDLNRSVSMQPRQYQPNYGGNQFIVENLYIESEEKLSSKNEGKKLDTIKEVVYLFLENKILEKNAVDKTQIVDAINSIAENYQPKTKISDIQNESLKKVINSPMLIKLLKHEL